MSSRSSSTTNAALGSRMSSLEAQVEGLHQGLERLASSVESLAHDVRRSRTPHFGTIFAGLGVLVAILSGLIVLGSSGPLDTLEALKIEAATAHARDLEEAEDRGAREARLALVERTLETLLERAHRSGPPGG